MSRIGRQPIAIPDSVKLTRNGDEVAVEGPLGQLRLRLPDGITGELDNERKQFLVKRATNSKRHRALHGLERTLVQNMVIGVTEGYKKELEIIGIGYSATLAGNTIAFQVGYANTVSLEVPEGIKVEVLQPTNPGRVVVSGCDKQQVGQFAARIRAIRPPEPYQGKGIRYAGEAVRRKAGKAFVGTG